MDSFTLIEKNCGDKTPTLFQNQLGIDAIAVRLFALLLIREGGRDRFLASEACIPELQQPAREDFLRGQAPGKIA